MSTDTNFAGGLGFKFRQSDLRKLFAKEVEGKYHEEPRWDPKTGKPLAPVLICDEDDVTVWTFNGKEYEDFEIPEAISKKLGCDFIDTSDNCSSDPDIYFIVSKGTKQMKDGDRIITDIHALPLALQKLEEGLKKIGLKPGKARIISTVWYT